MSALKAALGKERSEETVLRGLAGLQRLAHGSKHRLEPRRLRAGDAECGRGLVGRKSQKMRASGCRREAARSSGRVESAVVMIGRDQEANAAGDLKAGDK